MRKRRMRIEECAIFQIYFSSLLALLFSVMNRQTLTLFTFLQLKLEDSIQFRLKFNFHFESAYSRKSLSFRRWSVSSFLLMDCMRKKKRQWNEHFIEFILRNSNSSCFKKINKKRSSQTLNQNTEIWNLCCKLFVNLVECCESLKRISFFFHFSSSPFVSSCTKTLIHACLPAWRWR